MRGPEEAPDQYSQLECGHPRAPGKWEGDLSAVHVPPQDLCGPTEKRYTLRGGSQVTGRRASHNEIAPIEKVWYQLSLYEISGDAW